MNFVDKLMSLLFNMLSRFAIVFLPRRKHILISWLQTVHIDFGAQEKKSVTEKVKMKVMQLCPTLCNPVDYTIHGDLQARLLEWVAVPFSGGSSQPRDQIQVFHIAGGFFTSFAIRETQEYWSE